MYTIRTPAPADLAAVVDLVVRLQAAPEQHIGYHGVTEAEVGDELAKLAPGWTQTMVLAHDSAGVLRGVLSADVDPELGRAWLYGPYLELPEDHPCAAAQWQTGANALFEQVCALPALAGIADFELYGHRRHRLLADFAAVRGFAPGEVSRVFVLPGGPLRTLLVRDADSTVPGVRLLPDHQAARDSVAALHERCFPNRTVSGRGLVDPEGDRTVVVLDHGGIIGYAAGYPQVEEFYVDYVGVDPAHRSTGAGGALVRGLLRELAEQHGARGQAAAVIGLGNDASERMFTNLGFELHLELVGYRRKPLAAVVAS